MLQRVETVILAYAEIPLISTANFTTELEMGSRGGFTLQKYSGLRQKDRSHIRESPSTLIDQGPVVELPRETVQNPESSEIRITGLAI